MGTHPGPMSLAVYALDCEAREAGLPKATVCYRRRRIEFCTLLALGFVGLFLFFCLWRKDIHNLLLLVNLTAAHSSETSDF